MFISWIFHVIKKMSDLGQGEGSAGDVCDTQTQGHECTWMQWCTPTVPAVLHREERQRQPAGHRREQGDTVSDKVEVRAPAEVDL